MAMSTIFQKTFFYLLEQYEENLISIENFLKYKDSPQIALRFFKFLKIFSIIYPTKKVFTDERKCVL